MEEGSICSGYNGFHYWLIPAVTVSSGYSMFLRRRKNTHGHTVPPRPLQLLSTYSDRWSFAVAFGALFSIFLERLIGPEVVYCLYAGIPLWTIGVIQIIVALEVSVVHYPIFLCLSQENCALGNLLGFGYTLAWFIYQVVTTASSPPDQTVVSPGLRNIRLSKELASQHRSTWYHIFPSLLCSALLVLRFIFFNLMLLLQRSEPRDKDGRPMAQAHNIEYMKRLLRPTIPEPDSGRRRWFQIDRYTWDACFRFPARMLIMVVMALTGVYRIAFLPRIPSFIGTYLSNDISLADGIIIAISILGIIIHICEIMIQYRSQMRRLYKGDRKDLPRKLPATDVAVTRSMSYIGLQLAFLGLGMWTLYIFILVSAFSIVIPLAVAVAFFYKEIACVLVAVLVILIMAFLLRRLVVRRFFLQDKLGLTDTEKPLAFKNIRALESTCYFTLLFFMIKAGIEFEAQLLIRLTLGCLNLARIDWTANPSNPGGLLDTGYLTWLSVLLVDSAHTNPTVLTFCHLLLQSSQPDPDMNTKLHRTACKVAGARRRWWLAYTLLRNPGLVVLRRQEIDLAATPTAPPASMMQLEP